MTGRIVAAQLAAVALMLGAAAENPVPSPAPVRSLPTYRR